MNKKSVILLLLVMVFALGASAQLRKQRLFKVDPLSGLFKEIRVMVEHRWKDTEYFWYVAPLGHHHSHLGAQPQKHFGAGVRLGVRRYLFAKKSKTSPMGLFVQVAGGYRHVWMNFLGEDLAITNRYRAHELGGGVYAGYQWIRTPRKKTMAYGFMGGVEFYPRSWAGGIEPTEAVKSRWYEFGPVRIYLGIELGFAFLQKNLHWK